MVDTFYFDGGCRPNPGPMQIAVVHGPDTYITDIGNGDSSTAEWMALLFAVKLAKGAGARDVRFVGDNAMVVAQARGEASCRTRFRPLLEEFRQSKLAFDRVQVRHVARSKNRAGTVLERHVYLGSTIR